MSWFDKSFLAVLFLSVIILQCFWQRALIIRNRPIRHGWHALIYLAGAGLMASLFRPDWWQVFVIAILERLAFFDPILNWTRDKPFFYNGAGGSIQDRLENKL